MLEFNISMMKGVFYNYATSFCPVLIGFGTSILVNKLGSKIFQCEKDTYASQGMKFVAFVAGTAAGLYAGSFFPLYSFTAKEAFSVACLGVPVFLVTMVALTYFGHKRPYVAAMGTHLLTMALLGFPYPHLVPAIAGSGVGAVIFKQSS